MSSSASSLLPPKVYAEAILSSEIGEIEEPILREKQLFQAAQHLRSNGFDVIDIGKFSITVVASPEVYGRSLGTSLQAIECPVIKGFGKVENATFIRTSEDQGYIDLSRTEWCGSIQGFAINDPRYYFKSDFVSPEPPLTNTPYLSVPNGLANALNATSVHQQGITGKGVKVVMVDSGWYRHPFFEKHGYQVDVRLAPGSSDATTDMVGHGTGESANLLAIAPGVSLTMVKADTALAGGKHKNINSISALRTAIALKPDIITCSWGSDQRSPHLSASNHLLARYVADAVRQGITVIFAAGNGQHGFPAQHPEVIAAGGAYQHLEGASQGRLEASSYASGFVSQVYAGRRVPDLCGLVGHLPYGRYLMLPVPPGLAVDHHGDGTAHNDGWAVFSGTSAAAPQLAGVCALMKQINSHLSPAEIKQILQRTARDVVTGLSNPASGGAAARAGPDLATGSGLVDAFAAVQTAQGLTDSKCCDDCASSEQNFCKFNLTPVRRKTMSEFPKLQKKLDELRWEFEKKLQSAIEEYGLEDVELNISELNFVGRSPMSKVAYSLREKLEVCFEERNITSANETMTPEQIRDFIKEEVSKSKTGMKTIDKSKITEEQISSAQALLKISKYEETAIRVLTEALLITKNDCKGTKETASAKDEEKAQKLTKQASEALSNCGSEIAMFNASSKQKKSLARVAFFGGQKIKIIATKEEKYCHVNAEGKASCPGNITYEASEWTLPNNSS